MLTASVWRSSTPSQPEDRRGVGRVGRPPYPSHRMLSRRAQRHHVGLGLMFVHQLGGSLRHHVGRRPAAPRRPHADIAKWSSAPCARLTPLWLVQNSRDRTARLAMLWRSTCGAISVDNLPRLAIRGQNFLKCNIIGIPRHRGLPGRPAGVSCGRAHPERCTLDATEAGSTTRSSYRRTIGEQRSSPTRAAVPPTRRAYHGRLS